MSKVVTVGVTLGDPAGIGPEVACRAALKTLDDPGLRLVLVGAAELVRAELRACGHRHRIPCYRRLPAQPPALSIWDPGPQRIAGRPGRPTISGARAAHAWVVAAAEACRTGALSAMVTAPIHKAGFQRAGIDVPGHTELLAAQTGAAQVGMMLLGQGLRVVLATRHIPLRQVPDELTTKAVVEAGELAHAAVRWLRTRQHRIGICGLNPHAGEEGVLGDEEQRIILPAIRALCEAGIEAEGPLPGDTAFTRSSRARYGAIVAMYHDQGLAPLKALAFDSGVNLTLGLPIVRTSPDHGTAFDIAGSGTASPTSMLAAITLAARLARRRHPWAVT